MARRGRREGEAGFTLMEILIAMTILMIGLIPMLAVFRTALWNLNRSIEDTYASAIAQSVFDAIRVGLKDMKVEMADGTKFFIFDHDGVVDLEADRRTILRDADLANPANAQAILARDYAIVLPLPTETVASSTGGQPIGKKLLYPRKAAGSALRPYATPVETRVTGTDGTVTIGTKVKVDKVYQLGKKLKDSTLAVEQSDTYTQYGFAFTIRPAKSQDPNAPNPELKNQKVISGLYEVVVMVYRNFSAVAENRRNDPVGGREFTGYVAE